MTIHRETAGHIAAVFNVWTKEINEDRADYYLARLYTVVEQIGNNKHSLTTPQLLLYSSEITLHLFNYCQVRS